MKLQPLSKYNIPRNKAGDPHFSILGTTRLYDVFSPGEVHELVNRCLYQLEYQHRSHIKRRQEKELLEKPIRAKLQELFPGTSFNKATDEQLKQCLDALTKG